MADEPQDEAPRKRKYEDEDEGTEASESDNADGSAAKKQRLLKSKPSSSLRDELQVEANSSLPTPQVTGDEDNFRLGNGNGAGQGKQPAGHAQEEVLPGIDEDDLEADLIAEFEAEERHEKSLQKGKTEKG